MKKNILLTILLLFAGMSAATLRANDPVSGRIAPNHSPEGLDSLLSVWYRNNIESYDRFVNDFIDIDVNEYSDMLASEIPDAVFEARLNMLATVIQLPYNPVVKQYIQVYTRKQSALMSRILGLAQYYMPTFEECLDKHGLPAELKILPIIESALNPKAVSRAGAGGLWQFMHRVGKAYGLEINSFVDERFDPVASTEAACRFLKDLYNMYGDWTLVIAAYNCGPGNVNKALKRASDPTTYWDIYQYLPRETRGYIPAFIAATYAYTFHKAHFIEPLTPPHPIVTDTLMINRMVHFEQISSTLGIPVEILRDLNPQYKMDIIPGKEKAYALVLPIGDVVSYIEKEPVIYAKDSVYLQKFLNSNTAAEKITSVSSPSGAKTYKVRSGDNLGAIAKNHGVTVKQLMVWNKMTDPGKLRIGQVITVRK